MDKKIRYYISGAITGTTDYMERFNKAEEYLASKGYSVVNPAKVNAQLPTDTSYEDYMRMSSTMLNMCDRVYMMRGWDNSKGAKLEREWAVMSAKPIIYEGEQA